MVLCEILSLHFEEALSTLYLLEWALFFDMFHQFFLIEFPLTGLTYRPKHSMLMRALKVLHVFALKLKMIDVLIICVLYWIFFV